VGRSCSHFLAECGQRLDRADHDLEFDHFAGLVEFDHNDALGLPFADIGGKRFQLWGYSAARAILKAPIIRTGPP
jgi:hypothetical protein